MPPDVETILAGGSVADMVRDLALVRNGLIWW